MEGDFWVVVKGWEFWGSRALLGASFMGNGVFMAGNFIGFDDYGMEFLLVIHLMGNLFLLEGKNNV